MSPSLPHNPAFDWDDALLRFVYSDPTLYELWCLGRCGHFDSEAEMLRVMVVHLAEQKRELLADKENRLQALARACPHHRGRP